MNDLTNPAAGVAAGTPADLSRQASGDRPAPCGNPAHTTGAAQAVSQDPRHGAEGDISGVDHTNAIPGDAGCEPERSPPGEGAGRGVTSPAGAAPSYVPVRAMEDVLALRHEQIHKHGHTPEADALKPLKWFAEDLLDRAKATHEGIRFNKGNAVARLRLVKIAALAMAMIDRIDSEETEA